MTSTARASTATVHGAQDVTPARLARPVQAGRKILEEIKEELKNAYPTGTYVIINVDTREFLAADSLADAARRFTEKFHDAKGFVYRVGEEI